MGWARKNNNVTLYEIDEQEIAKNSIGGVLNISCQTRIWFVHF